MTNHDILRVCVLKNIFWDAKQLVCHFYAKWSQEGEKRLPVSFMHEQNIICSQTQLDGIAHEQNIIVGSYLQVTWWPLGQ